MADSSYIIDAAGKKLGRVASEAAVVLMGKDKPGFRKNILSKKEVVIKNASKVLFNEKKLRDKLYERYSGYPGGLRFHSLDEVITKKGYGEVFRLAVHGMLPGNTLRARMMKNLKVEE